MQIDQPGIILFTEHFEACAAFYRDIIGLPVMFAHSGLVCLQFGGAYLMVESHGVASAGTKSRAENPCVIRFNVPDVDAAAEELRRSGVAVEVQRYDWGVIGVFHDPDGNRCELKDSWQAGST